MSLRPQCLLLAALACLAQSSQAGDAPQPRRTTISLLAGGKEVAGLVLLPGQGQRSFSFNALRQEEAPDGSLHASGHVQLSLRIGDTPPLTIYGDDLIVRSDALDADQAQALEDLKNMGASDQSIRGNPANLGKDDWARQEAIDKANMARLAAIVARYGWPGMRFAGAEYANNAFLVLQHADTASQHTYLPLVRAAAARGDVPAADLALLEDRVLKSEGKPQLYGTQFEPGKPLRLYKVADEAQLDQRRRAMGLPPMNEYLQMMRQMYQSD
jgi:hypothetical protein